jgi:hypothetical protein
LHREYPCIECFSTKPELFLILKCADLLAITPTPPDSGQNQTQRSAGRVDRHVPRGSHASRHKGLMPFVRSGVKHRHPPGHERRPHRLGLIRGPSCSHKKPPGQPRQDRVLRDMGPFADHENHLIDRRARRIRHQPAQQGAKKTRTSTSRSGIGGGPVNHAHPQHQGAPVPESLEHP